MLLLPDRNDRTLGSGRHDRSEIARSLSINEIAPPIADFRFDSTEVEQEEAARKVLDQAMRLQAQRS